MTEHEIVQVEARPFLHVSRTCASRPDVIGTTMREAFSLLGAFLTSRRLCPTGPPVSVYHHYDANSTSFDVGFPLSSDPGGMEVGDITSGMTPSGKALRIMHIGPYHELHDTYQRVMNDFKDKLQLIGPCWEIYVDDPATTPPEKLRTELYFLVA